MAEHRQVPEPLAHHHFTPWWHSGEMRLPRAESGWLKPERWFRAAVKAGERRRVFCSSQADVFEDRRDLDEHRTRLWELIDNTAAGFCGPGRDVLVARPGPDRPGLDWLLLTTRPERILELIPERWRAGLPPNVWVGASVENQEAADERIEHLQRVPARVRFLSVEPLLGPVNVGEWVSPLQVCPACTTEYRTAEPRSCCGDDLEVEYGVAMRTSPPIHWLIIGGESGPKARPCDVAWIRNLVRQGRDADVPVFVKQLGAYPLGVPDCSGCEGVEFDGAICSRCGRAAVVDDDGRRVLVLADRNGRDPAEWPEDLRVQALPRGAR
ncbi:MAG: DUF5131 family protein [Kofleriaceae bacterium]